MTNTLIPLERSPLLTNLPSLGIGSQEINNFDSSHQNFLVNIHVYELWGFLMDGGMSVGRERREREGKRGRERGREGERREERERGGKRGREEGREGERKACVGVYIDG